MNEVKKILDKNDLHPVKSFGQNFLFDNNIINKIANAQAIEGKNVIEIGPGLGNLTEKIIAKAKKLVAIEIDKKLISVLQDKFNNKKNFKVINEDFLNINLQKLIAEEFDNEKGIIVIANLPYYLTSPIILKLVSNFEAFNSFTLMMQKEVAVRLTAKINSKNYSNLSIMVQYYCDSKILFDIKPQSFYPCPKVTSSLVFFKMKHQNILTKAETDKFWTFTRAMFANKRKTLNNNLKVFLNDKEKATEIIEQLNWPATIRAEGLTFTMFYELFKKINK